MKYPSNKFKCGWCGHPCTEEGDYIPLSDLFENAEEYKNCKDVDGKCCADRYIPTNIYEEDLF